MNKQNKIKKSMQAKIKASQQQQPQEPIKSCGCGGGGGSSERANLVRRVINIKKKAKP